jgi:hypothetical protein
MEGIRSVITFFMENADLIVALVLAILSVMELAVRLTPTKADDGAVERIGKIIRKALDFLKVPNIKK